MKLVIATRLHLGRASSPPPRETIQQICNNLKKIADDCVTVDELETEVLIAVDATPKFEEYDYVEAVRSTLEHCKKSNGDDRNNIHVLPVTPW